MATVAWMTGKRGLGLALRAYAPQDAQGRNNHHQSCTNRDALDDLRKLWAFAGPIVLNARSGK